MSDSKMVTGNKTLFVFCQVYVPDPAAVGQHVSDVAAELVRRGWRVVVFTANRGYDNPHAKYPRLEVLNGVEIKRLPYSSFGKNSMVARMLAGLFFTVQCTVYGLFSGNLTALMITTAPPLSTIAALVVSRFRRLPVYYWVMDLNPDQMISLGLVSERSLIANLFYKLNCLALLHFRKVIILDRFMAKRFKAKCVNMDGVSIIPPWPLEYPEQLILHNQNPFRAMHNLERKFVVMYSGNHAVSNPIDTIVQAALRMQDIADLVFVFVGGGVGKKEIDRVIKELQPVNIMSLPYEPLEKIKYSLSAADLHIVSIGDKVVGSVHPCKIYGAMAVGRPILYLGPKPSHVSEILSNCNIGRQVEHDDVDGAMAAIKELYELPDEQREEMGLRARSLIESDFSREKLLKGFCDLIDE